MLARRRTNNRHQCGPDCGCSKPSERYLLIYNKFEPDFNYQIRYYLKRNELFFVTIGNDTGKCDIIPITYGSLCEPTPACGNGIICPVPCPPTPCPPGPCPPPHPPCPPSFCFKGKFNPAISYEPNCVVNTDCQNNCEDERVYKPKKLWIWTGKTPSPPGASPEVIPGWVLMVECCFEKKDDCSDDDDDCSKKCKLCIFPYDSCKTYSKCDLVRVEGDCDDLGGVYQANCKVRGENPKKSRKWHLVISDGKCGEVGPPGKPGRKGENGLGFTYYPCFDSCTSYCKNDVVRYKKKCEPGILYIYTLDTPSRPGKNPKNIQGFEIFLKDGSCDDCNCEEECDCAEDDDCSRRSTERSTECKRSERYSEPCSEKPKCDLCFRGEWCRDEKYFINDLVIYESSTYIAIRNSCGEKPCCKEYWILFVAGINFRGEWDRREIYYLNNIVKYDNVLYIATACEVRVRPSEDCSDWKILIDCCKEKPDCSTLCSSERNERPIPSESTVANLMTDKEINDLLTNYDGKSRSNVLYLLKQKKTVINFEGKLEKWWTVISFNDVVKTSSAFTFDKTSVSFNKSGIFKVSLQLTYTGVNVCKVLAYLLDPKDNVAENSSYNKNKKVRASKIRQYSLANRKNTLNYSFILNVSKPLSQLVMTNIHKQDELNGVSTLTIFGKDRTWLLIEEI